MKTPQVEPAWPYSIAGMGDSRKDKRYQLTLRNFTELGAIGETYERGTLAEMRKRAAFWLTYTRLRGGRPNATVLGRLWYLSSSPSGRTTSTMRINPLA